MRTHKSEQEENPNRRLKLAAYGIIMGVFLFIILSTINMLIYPGSYHIN